MNLLKKTMPWVVGSLIVTATAYGNDNTNGLPAKRKSFDQGQKMARNQMQPGYNAASRIDVRGSWDVYVSASFIFWQLSQDNMEVAFADGLSNTVYTTNNQIKGSFVEMDFDYKPGFQVGLGVNFDHDEWDAYAEYTRIHTSNTQTTSGAPLAAGGTGPLLPTFGHPYVVQTNVYDTATENWHCNLDTINLDLARAYYVGAQLTFRPFFGARSAFITQNVHANYVNTSFLTTVGSFIEIPGTMDVYQRNQSWSIGPRVGVNTNWNVGQGVRFFGNANADVLYTKYKLQNKTNFVPTTTTVAGGQAFTAGTPLFAITRERVFALRTHLDLELGLGWGSYFDNNNWHIDLSAAYGFQVFFDQNMANGFFNAGMPGKVLEPHGNLYAHGLTATVRFDF